MHVVRRLPGAAVLVALAVVATGCGSSSSSLATDGVTDRRTAPTSVPSTPDLPPDLSPSAAASAAVTAPVTANLVDDRTGAFAEVGLDPSSATYRGMRVGIPGVGLLWTSSKVTLGEHTDHSATVHYDGRGHLDRRAKLDLEFGGVATMLRGPIRTVRLRIDGTVDKATGRLYVQVEGRHVLLQAAGSRQDADDDAGAVVRALAANDWAEVYRLSDSDVRAAVPKAAFVAKADTAHVDTVRITGPITYRTVTTGVSYASVPVFEQVTAGGRTKSATATIILVREGGAWRMFDTR